MSGRTTSSSAESGSWTSSQPPPDHTSIGGIYTPTVPLKNFKISARKDEGKGISRKKF